MANPVVIAPSLGHGVTWLQGVGAPGYDAIDLRRPAGGSERGEGVATYGSFRVKERGAGANNTVDVLMDEPAWVRGDSVSLQGIYQVSPHSGTINVDVTAADGSNPRIDQVVLEVKDNAHDAGGLSEARVRVVAGTATVGATLDNRTGAAALPASSLLLADILRPTSDAAVNDAEIRDRRAFSAPGVVPPLLTKIDMAMLLPVVAGVPLAISFVPGAGADLQVAALCYLPRRITATRLRWKYTQGSTAVTGAYAFGLYDASGRKIVETGSVSFTGAANSIQVRSETLTATTFEPGAYYVVWGVDPTNAGALSTSVVELDGTKVNVPNTILRTAPADGDTLPTTILAFSDMGTSASAIGGPDEMPVVALSVG